MTARIISVPDGHPELTTDTQHRLGRLSLHRDLVFHAGPTVTWIMHNMIVISAEPQVDTNHIHYMALSPHFDRIPKHTRTPFYHCEMFAGRHGGRRMSGYRFTRVKPEDEPDYWHYLPAPQPVPPQHHHITPSPTTDRLVWTDTSTGGGVGALYTNDVPGQSGSGSTYITPSK